MVHSHSNKSNEAIWINQVMVASKQNGDHCCVRFIFAKKLLVAMLKSLKDILVQVYFANESLEHDCFLLQPHSTHQFHEPLFPWSSSHDVGWCFDAHQFFPQMMNISKRITTAALTETRLSLLCRSITTWNLLPVHVNSCSTLARFKVPFPYSVEIITLPQLSNLNQWSYPHLMWATYT